VGTPFLPVADVATRQLPLGQLLRLSLFQVPVDVARLLNGTLLCLATLKDWFMVSCLPSQARWNWGLRSHGTGPAA
jgi:hypothetical protein